MLTDGLKVDIIDGLRLGQGSAVSGHMRVRLGVLGNAFCVRKSSER